MYVHLFYFILLYFEVCIEIITLKQTKKIKRKRKEGIREEQAKQILGQESQV